MLELDFVFLRQICSAFKSYENTCVSYAKLEMGLLWTRSCANSAGTVKLINLLRWDPLEATRLCEVLAESGGLAVTSLAMDLYFQ